MKVESYANTNIYQHRPPPIQGFGFDHYFVK